jgi:hypothetical protein
LNTSAAIALWATRRYTGPRIVDLREVSARRQDALRSSRHGAGPTKPGGNGDRGGGFGDNDGREAHGSDRRARLLAIVALVLGLTGIVGSWIWMATSDARALRALPAPQRAHVLHSALTNLTDVCDPFPPRSLATFCREQAEIAASFDECDSTCLAIARRHLNQPVR